MYYKGITIKWLSQEKHLFKQLFSTAVSHVMHSFDAWCTDQLSSRPSGEEPLKHVHAQLPVVGYAMRVLRQSEQETLVFICGPATQPAGEKNREDVASNNGCKWLII